MLSLLTSGFTLLVLLIGTGVNCQQLTAAKTEEFSLEGSSVTLSYSYSNKISSSDHFFWYRQYPGKPPEFIMYISGLNNPRLADNLKSASRFSTKLREEKHLDLLISSAAVTDSAVYYCAVRPTVTGNTRTLYKNLQYSTISTRGPHTLFLLYGLLGFSLIVCAAENKADIRVFAASLNLLQQLTRKMPVCHWFFQSSAGFLVGQPWYPMSQTAACYTYTDPLTDNQIVHQFESH
ncbi:uncharacterized protein LOC119775165 [Cyprinodon tularosa]|uniref:uncharacterized protein LOC119775165 n=1 Tax=Cyprinodon tularosa TaxID=77115 RepID=UPI0018E204B8|nr:uncharacterized protein LOC119775165 [Cyprinodon tularosa]